MRKTHGILVGARRNGYPSIYRSWALMKSRCHNKNNPHYHNYGGRGINICGRWLGKDGFASFWVDMGEKPDGTTLDRIDNNGNYESSNCRWATRAEQARNKRNTRLNEIAVKVIRYMFEKKGYGHTRIGRAMGISREYIRDIVTYKNWRDI